MKENADPQGPIAAVTHPDPYAYYRNLVMQKPLYYDETLKSWVASSASAVTAVLTSDLCRVRPADEPVPKALIGSAAGDIFGNLARMNDGEKQHEVKLAVTVSVDGMDFRHVPELSGKWARDLSGELKPESDLSKLSDFAFRLPVYVMASLLGIPENELARISELTGDLTSSFSPLADAGQIERGRSAAENLLALFRARMREADKSGGLLRSLARHSTAGEEAIAANAIGFLTQAYEATAGLIGNALVALSTHDDVRQLIETEPELLADLMAEVARYDSPVQNTRRFVINAGMVAGQEMKSGDNILVILAAANHDSAANTHPERLDIFRKDRRSFTFGTGSHACPGQKLAEAIACAGVRQILKARLEFTRFTEKMTYRASVNTRIPVFQN